MSHYGNDAHPLRQRLQHDKSFGSGFLQAACHAAN